jgi:glycosyltransferase 2 family protein
VTVDRDPPHEGEQDALAPPPHHHPEHPTGPHEHGHSYYEPGEFLDAPPEEAISEAEVSLQRRLFNWRTIGSIIFALVLVFLLFRVVLNVDLQSTVEVVKSASPTLLLAAFVVYYLTFPLRSFRWWLVLRNVGTHVRYRDATEILFLSWFVNCLVPAKLGDLYRAYLMRGNYGSSISRTVGTIFLERIADLVLIFTLALAAGFWSFRGRNRPEVDALFITGFVFIAILVLFLVVLRSHGQRLTRYLPERLRDLYERFHEGSTGAMRPLVLAEVGAVTAAIWLLEGGRIFFVIQSLNLPGVHLGISASIFVAMGASLLTAIPLTPAGIGFVQGGIVLMLGLYGVPAHAATAVALVDFVISTLSVIVVGGVLYAFSGKIRRAHGAGPAPT